MSRRKSAIFVKQDLANQRERKHENRTRRDDGVLRYRDNEALTAADVRLASQERADKVRAPVSSYIHERNMAKYLVVKYGREEAARIIDARSAIFRR